MCITQMNENARISQLRILSHGGNISKPYKLTHTLMSKIQSADTQNPPDGAGSGCDATRLTLCLLVDLDFVFTALCCPRCLLFR